MTTSGVVQSKNPISDLIDIAFDYCGINVEEEETTAEEYQRALRYANQMLRSWQAQGLHLWQYQEGILFTELNRNAYGITGKVLEPEINSLAHVQDVVCVKSDMLTIATTLNSLETGDTLIEIVFQNYYWDDGTFYQRRFDVSSGPNIVGWIIGIDVGGWIWWDVIIDVGLLSSSGAENRLDVTLQVGLPFGLDDETFNLDPGQKCYLYPPEATINDAERVLNTRRVQYVKEDFSIETPINFTSHQEFFNLPNRRNAGVLNQATFDRQKDNGVFHIWQPPTDPNTYQLAFTYERTFQKFINPSDTADFPNYWEDAFCWNLADKIAIPFNVPESNASMIRQKAAETMATAQSYDDANYDLKVTLNNRMRR